VAFTRLAFWLCLCCLATGAWAQLKKGDMSPDLLGYQRDGTRIETASFRGTPLVVTYWASWCGPCLRELPMLEAIQKKVGPEQLRVVAVNIEERTRFREVTRRMLDWQIQLGNDPRKEAYAAFGVNGIPHLVVIGRDGVIRRVFRGYSEKAVEAIVTEMVEAINEP
jgi:thiol-disulfide isomerase/thioredoxin